MTATTTKEEREAARGAIENLDKTKDQFDQESDSDKNTDVWAIEELAAMYVSVVGLDNSPASCKAVFKAGQAAGRITEKGDFISPDKENPSPLTTNGKRRMEEEDLTTDEDQLYRALLG